MKFIFVTLTFWLLPFISAELEFTENLMNMVEVVLDLSVLVYKPTTPPENLDYDLYHFYDDQPSQPDQAILAGAGGYCFAVFRGTKAFSVRDWKQNIQMKSEQFCISSEDCCDAHKGFLGAYNADYVQQLEADLRDCVDNYCTDPSGDCLVLGGMSQGAGIATIASAYFAEFNPIVIGLGQPGAVTEGCSLIDSDRHYRFIGAMPEKNGYDPVALYGPRAGYFWYGHTFLASTDDESSFAYLGLDNQDIELKRGNAETHFASTRNVRAIVDYYDGEGTYPVRISGYTDGSSCTIDEECESKNCGFPRGTSSWLAWFEAFNPWRTKKCMEQ